MEPRMPASQQPPTPMMNNLQPIYGQQQPNKFIPNGQGQYMQQAFRQQDFQPDARFGRNVPPAGSINAKSYELEPIQGHPSAGLMQMNNPGMATSMNMPGGPGIQSAYPRGPQMYPYPNMPPGPGNRPPQHQSAYNHMLGQMPMDMMPQQRFQGPMQGGPRFPNDSGLQQVPFGHPNLGCGGGGASYDNTGSDFGVKVRPIPPPLQLHQQGVFSTQSLPANSPIMSVPSQQKSLASTPTSMCSVDASEAYIQQPQQSRQPNSQTPTPMAMTPQQHQLSSPQQHQLSSPQQHQLSSPQQHQLSSPQQSMGSLGSFAIPPHGTACSICLGDLCEPPLQSPSPNSNPSQPYPPIQCEAGCRGWYHLPCSGLSLDAFVLLKSESNFVEWLCNSCASQAAPNIPYLRARNPSAH